MSKSYRVKVEVSTVSHTNDEAPEKLTHSEQEYRTLEDGIRNKRPARSRKEHQSKHCDAESDDAREFDFTSGDDEEFDPSKDSGSDDGRKKRVLLGRKRGGRPRKESKESPSDGEPKKRGRPRDKSKHNVSCEICGKVFKYLYQLKPHEKLHFGIKDYECEHCHMRFVQKGAMMVHLRKHTGEKPFKCSYCPEAFKEKISLDYHTYKHTQQGAKCPLCSSVFPTSYSVKQHMKQVHTQEKPHVCQICGKGYKNRRDMVRHIEGHDRRICSVCDKVFDTMYALKTHMHVHDDGPRCSLCNRVFKSDEELQAHSKLRGRAFQCELCCYSFNKAEFLSNHHRRNHWKVLGLEQLVWNFPPRSKKPKPPKKAKAPLPIVQVEDIAKDESILVSPPVQECNTQMQLDQEVPSEPLLETDPTPMTNNESMKETIACEDQSDLDEIPFVDDVSDSDTADNTLSAVIENTELEHTNADLEVKVEPEEVFVKVEDDEEHDTSDQPQALLSEFNEVDVKSEDLSHSEDDDDLPLAILRQKLCPKRELKLDVEEAKQVKMKEKKLKSVAMSQQTRKRANPNLRCSVCLKFFKSRSSLKHHQKIHIGVKNFKCKICKKTFMTKGGLGAHQTTHTGEKRFECTFCSARFRTQYSLDYHAFTHTQQAIKCDLCPKLLPSLHVVKLHVKSAHIKKEPFRCHICRKSFKKKESLRHHLKRHDSLPCKVCGEICKGREALVQHRKTVHRVVKKAAPLICELCGKSYATVSSLCTHRATHKEYQRFKCDQCSKAFFFKGLLEAHIRVEHQGERQICAICGKLFKYGTDLRRHQRQHSEEKPFKCEQCPAAFRHMSNLRSHKATHSKTVYPCDVCRKEYRSADGLRKHKRTHTEGSRFQCEICNRKFSQKAPLMKHMTIHTLDRQLKCVVCEQIYYKKVELMIHQAKEHPNHPLIGKTIKVHTCNICGMEFTKKNFLAQHVDIHGTEYKFKCEMCNDQKFKQKAGLRHHWKHFHRIEPPKRNLANKAKAVDTEMKVPLLEEAGNRFETEVHPANTSS